MCIILFLSKETNESPVDSQDREIAVVNDENNNEVIKEEEDDGNHGTSAENDITVVGAMEEDVCENVNVKEMRKFFIEQGHGFAIRVSFNFFIKFPRGFHLGRPH